MEINQAISQARMNEEIARSTWQDAFNKRVKKTQDGQFSAQIQEPEEDKKKDRKQPKADAEGQEPRDTFVASKPEPSVTYKPV